MSKFPLLGEDTEMSKLEFVDDFKRVMTVYPSLDIFETTYEWNYLADHSITPIIQFEWEVLNKRLGQMYIRRANRVLSIGGGGNSRTLDYLSSSLQYLCVLNPSVRDLQMYRGLTKEDERILLVRGVGETMPFTDASFDLVEIPATLDHCHDYRKVLEECYRVLVIGGKVAITGGNNKSWYRKLVSKLGLRIEDAHHHTVHLAPDMLTNSLIASGFSEIHIQTNYFLKMPKRIERRFNSKTAFLVYGFVGNRLLPKLLGKRNGGMLLVGGTK